MGHFRGKALYKNQSIYGWITVADWLCVFQDNNGEDSHRISPSPVVHVRGLCEAVVEADLIDALEKFGPIWWDSN